MSGFISQPCRPPETCWYQINNLRRFDPFSTSRDGIPMGTLDYFWSKWTFGKFDTFITPSETGRSVTSDTASTSLNGISCTCCTDCGGVIISLLFYCVTFGTCVGVSLGYYSISGVNQIYLRSIVYGAPLCDLSCKRYFQFGGMVPYLMNGTVENSSSNTTWNWGETWPVVGFRTRVTYTALNDKGPR